MPCVNDDFDKQASNVSKTVATNASTDRDFQLMGSHRVLLRCRKFIAQPRGAVETTQRLSGTLDD
jgi:hypothetical protein